MDIFDFEELIAEILDISDEEREDSSVLELVFYDKFEIDFHLAYDLALTLIMHTPIVEAGLSGDKFHAFVSRKSPYMIMKRKIN